MYVRNDCKTFRFCRGKCRKFWMKKKNPRKFKWTKAYRAAQGKDLVVDSTFDFEQRRNRPIKYDRNIVAQTLRTIRLIDEIRQQREAAHWERRMRTAATIETRQKLFDIAQNINLIEHVPEVVREQTQRAEAEINEHKAMILEERRQKRLQQKQENGNNDQ
ncbi:putative ribosome biogenesis protein RLP24 [Histomonas meleagridis]|uniref:putative ribosome biogenesis protein RLP24 n=1 Tax=Histomonas meleagridis TaxID=135588 RepID=UPI0035599CFB|nr:putative ribosome biogenesis protein RLP24 [Histomonas meleagridis]KAH0802694.1 putative ribosome biogenesis protein RLP24 [Histomonas meleagridis]